MKFQKLLGGWNLIVMIVFIGCLLGLGVGNSSTNIQAQEKEKVVTLARTINPQFKFADLKIGEQELKFNENFKAELGWVKNLSFKLEGISKKPITFVSINVNFPETRETGPMMSYGFSFGELPGRKITGSKPILIMPGEILEVSLDKETERIYKFMSGRQSIESVQKVELEIGFIVFEDKTAWSAGAFMRQDSNNPNRYNPIEREPPH